MTLPVTGYIQQVEVVVGGTLPRAGFVQPVENAGGGGGLITGGGAAGQVTFWSGPTTVTGSTTFLYDDTNKKLTIGFDGSNYTELTVDGSGNLSISPTGLITTLTGTLRLPSTGGTGVLFVDSAPAAVSVDALNFYWNSGQKTLDLLKTTSTTASLRFGSAQGFYYEAANSLGLRNGTNAQTFSVYNTYTAGTPDYERLEMFWSSNVAVIRTAANGTGSARDLHIRYSGTTSQAIVVSTALNGGLKIANVALASGSASGICSFANTAVRGATSGTNIEVQINPTFQDGGTNSTTVSNSFILNAIINYTGATRTGKVVLAYFNPTLTSIPTGVNAALCYSATASALGGAVWMNQTDETTNYEYVYAKFLSNVWTIGSVKGGSGTLRGLCFGIAGNSISFYGGSPVALQTGVPVTAAGIHAALVALNLFTA